MEIKSNFKPLRPAAISTFTSVIKAVAQTIWWSCQTSIGAPLTKGP